MEAAGRPAFSFGELLVLIDVDGVGAMSVPLPTPAEAAELTGKPLRGTGACVELHGPVRFRTGLPHLYEAPHTDLVVSPAHVLLSITRFADEDIWKNMLEWVDGYLDSALTRTARSAGRDGFHEYEGQGVVASLAFARPNVRHDPRELVLEVGLRHDEPALATVRRLLGLAADAPIAPADDGNWRELHSTWPMHLECSRHAGTVRFRFSAPHHDGQTSTASLCEEWCWRWLDLYAAAGVGQHSRSKVAWDLGPLGHASIVRGDGAHRRDIHELHVPAAWLAP